MGGIQEKVIKANNLINKGKYKTVIPNYMDSFSNKYPNYLQSSLNDDIFLLKKKLNSLKMGIVKIANLKFFT